MIRYIKVAVLILIVFFLGSEIQIPKISSASFDTVLKESLENVDVSQMQEMSNQNIRRFLNMNPDEYEAVRYYRHTDPMQADEVVIVQFKNVNQGEEFQEKIKRRIKDQKVVFEGYIDSEVQKLDVSILDVQSNYALYCVGDFSKKLDEQFIESLGI